jgi:hypothetical protein
MIRIDISEQWDTLRADPSAFQRYVLDVYGADRIEMAMFPYAAVLSADGQRLGLVNTYGYPRVTIEDGRTWLELSDLLLSFGPIERDALREQFAALAHEQWSGWMRYLFSKIVQQADGSLVIPAGYVAALRRQIDTPYAELLPEEQDGDRAEADKVLALFSEVP